MAVKPIPEGYHTVTPYIAVDDAKKAIDFYKRAFGAEERMSMDSPEGTIAHAELKIGDSTVMLSDPFPQSNIRPPSERGGPTTSMFLYVDDVDAWVQRAVDEGAQLVMPVETQFWGDRWGTVTDPFGHHWQIATHVEDVDPEEMQKRAAEAMAAMT